MRYIAIGLLAAATLFGTGIASAEPQPNMVTALQHLEAAQAELSRAISHENHGGHAKAANDLVRQAIYETKAGIAFRDVRGR